MLPRPAVVLHWTGVAAAFLFFIIIAESSNNSQALFMLIVKFPSLFIQILFFFSLIYLYVGCGSLFAGQMQQNLCGGELS